MTPPPPPPSLLMLSGQLSKVFPNIPVGPNRNNLFHLICNRISWILDGIEHVNRTLYPILFYSNGLSTSSTWSFYLNFKNPHFGKRMQKFLSVYQGRQFTDCQSSILTWFLLLKKFIDVSAADVKSTVTFKELHLTDGYTDCSPWFRPLKSLQSSTTITPFRR